jgi:cytidylate kinase
MRRPIIAFDGPSGAGKGTVARAVANALGFVYVDTGAMYRAIGWKAVRTGIALDDEKAVRAVAEHAVLELTLSQVLIDGVDVTRDIRTPAIDRAAASVARLPAVRAALVKRQRDLGASGGIVMEGRDIGTVVFPDADVKIYLDASAEERAKRRVSDPAHSGGPVGPAAVSEVATLMTERDRLDSTRAISPLYAADDAVVVDTTGKSIAQVVSDVMAVVDARLAGRR